MKKLCSRLISTEVEFYRQKQQNCVLCHIWGLRGNVHGSSIWLVGKRVVDFLLALIERFSLALMAAALLSEICRNRRFPKGWVTETI